MLVATVIEGMVFDEEADAIIVWVRPAGALGDVASAVAPVDRGGRLFSYASLSTFQRGERKTNLAMLYLRAPDHHIGTKGAEEDSHSKPFI